MTHGLQKGYWVNRLGNNINLADVEKVVMHWMENKTGHNIPLSQTRIQSKAVTIFHSVKSREVRKMQKKSLKLAEVVHDV